MIYFVLFLSGAILGSFLNVVIYRLPINKSLVIPRSACPACQAPIPLWGNIPIIGYMLLAGKCFQCKTNISKQYPFVEIFTGLLTVFCGYHFGLSSTFFVYIIFLYFLLVLSVIDIKTHLIYNKLLIALMAFGLISQIFIPFTSWNEALVGFSVGGVSMYIIAILGKAIFKKESLGMGDVKLAAVAGFFVGWVNILLSLYIGFVFALVTIVIVSRIKKIPLSGYYFPLGPFISAGLTLLLFWGVEIKTFYLNMMY